MRPSCKLLSLWTLLAIAALATAPTADAKVRLVAPGDDLQAAVDAAAPGDTILVEPGLYTTSNADFGLRVRTDNLRLVGKVKRGQGEAGKVRLRASGTQHTGVYAAPAACGPQVGVGGCPDELQGFYIRGFTVEDFPRNGIQTRFVNGFEIRNNESARNGFVNGNGIYPTISANGLVANNVSYGSLDTAMWVAASENVRVIGNEAYDSVIGLEISVSNDVQVIHNKFHHNTVGVALIHPNGAGNAQLPVMENWVVENNYIYSNNLPNPAPPDSFQAGLPPGIGVAVLGVSNHVVARNRVEDNDFVGIGVLGWCSATATNPERNCRREPPQAPPAASNNLISGNRLLRNGGNPPGGPFAPVAFLAADLTFFDLGEGSAGNCFENNRPAKTLTFVSSIGELPTDGCL